MVKNTIIRTASAAVGLVVFFIAVSMKSTVFEAIVAAVSVFMACEVICAIKMGAPGVAAGAVLASALNIGLYFKSYDLICALVLICVVVFAAMAVIFNERYSFMHCGAASFAVIYIVFSMHYISCIRDMDKGVHLMFIAFICAWISDTGAYFCGMLFGKHKLIEKISPKKTVEGAWGGILFSGLGGAVFGIIEKALFANEANILMLFLVCAIGSVMGQLGDLVESMMKRYFKVKDFGNIMPGHGGLTDRFDSVMLTAPYAYAAILFCIHADLPLLS